jgi:hypothetical protein
MNESKDNKKTYEYYRINRNEFYGRFNADERS